MGIKPFVFVIDLPVRNEWANVDIVRNSILNCFSAIFRDVDGCHAFAMVAGELMENAIKYGHWSTAERPFRLRVIGYDGRVEVSVENPVDPHSKSLNDLFETLEWIGRFPSAEEAYRAKLLEVANTSRDLGVSKLGLVRIAYESNCHIKASLEGETLRVSSQIRMDSATH